MFLKYTTPKDRLFWCLGTVFTIITSLIPAASTIIIGKLFDQLSQFTAGKVSPDVFMSKTLKLCCGLFIIAAIDFVVCSINGIIWRLVGFKVGHRTRLALFKAYCDGDQAWMDTNTDAVGVASQAFEDVKKIEVATGLGISVGLSVLTTLISCYAVAFYYSWAVTLVCMAGFPIVLLTLFFSTPYLESIAQSRKGIEDKINARLHFVFGALNTVKVFRKQSHEQRLCGDLFKEVYNKETKMWQISSIQQSIIRFLTLSMFVQGFFFGSYMVRHHGLRAGAVMSTFWACIEGTQALQGFYTFFVVVAEGTASAARLDNIMAQDKITTFKKTIGLVRPRSTVPMDISFENVVFSYPSRPELVLRGLNMHLKAGETHFIIGPSGCGKSSIASILLKQYTIEAGKVMVGDNLIETMAPLWVHENVTLVEQSSKLFDLPILDNLKMAHKRPETITNDLCEAALHEFQADFVYDLPHGILTPGRFPLSGGQQQRIQLAKAWISNSPVMIFDESTSALDPALEREVMVSIRNFRKGQTTIIITHNLDNIPEGSPCHLIEDGEAFYFENIDVMKKQKRQSTMQLSCLNDRKSTMPIEKKKRTSTVYEDYKVEVMSATETIETSIAAPVDDNTVNSYTIREYFKTIPRKPLVIIGFLAVVVQAVLTPVFSLVFSHLLMGILPGHDQGTTKWALLLLLVSGLDAVFTYFGIILQYVASRWCLDTRNSIIGKLLHYKKISHDDIAYYKKLIIGDIEASRNIIVRYWHGWVNLITLGLTGMIWALIVGWKLSLVGLAMTPLVVGITYYYKKVNQVWNSRFENEALQVKRLLEDIVTGYRTVKTQNLEKFFEKHYIKREKNLWTTSKRLAYFTSPVGGLLEIFTPLAQGVLMWLGFKLVSTNEYSPQKTMLVFSMLVFSLVTIDGIAKAIQQCGNAFEALPRIMRTYGNCSDHEHDAVGQDFIDTCTIDWRKISFSHVTANNTLVQDFSKTVVPGKCTAICGPSGSGKTTISRLLLKLQQPTNGTIYIDGHDILTLPNQLVRQRCAIAPQMPIDLFEGTILENLSYGLDSTVANQYESLAIKYCKKCGLHDYIENMEDGYDTIIKQGSLSGGQMQRLGIVRALMTDPSILILDEPTSALDGESSAMISEIIQDCTGSGITVLLITHQRSMAEMADDKIDIFE